MEKEWLDKWNAKHIELCEEARHQTDLSESDYRNQNMVLWIETILVEAKRVYYNTGDSYMEDRTYDELETRLRTLSPNHKFLEKVG